MYVDIIFFECRALLGSIYFYVAAENNETYFNSLFDEWADNYDIMVGDGMMKKRDVNIHSINCTATSTLSCCT